MSIVSKTNFNTIERQMYNRARDVDVSIFNALFDEENKDFVIDTLLMYQNNDGGFGGGLFIDNYNPASTVFVTYEALRLLYICGFDKYNKNEYYVKLINKACNYLYNRVKNVKNKWEYSAKDNEAFAHSEFFSYDKDLINLVGYYPTASIYALTLYLCPESKAYYKKALGMLKISINEMNDKEELNQYEVMSASLIVEILSKLNLLNEECDKLNALALKSAKTLCDDKALWPSSKMPVILMDGLKLDDEGMKLVDESLDSVIDSISSHGLWEAFHNWGTKYPEEDSAKLKWIGYISANYLYMLKKYNKIEKKRD